MPRTVTRRGPSRSPYKLGERKERAKTLFARGYTVNEVAHDLRVKWATAKRYQVEYEDEIRALADSNPTLLTEVLDNTVRMLHENERVRKEAWVQYEATESRSLKAAFLAQVHKSQAQRAQLLGLFGVKAEFMAHVNQVQRLQNTLIEFMRRSLCPEDKARLEEFLLRELGGNLPALPALMEAPLDTPLEAEVVESEA